MSYITLHPNSQKQPATTSQALDDGYPEEEKKTDASSSENQDPRHIRLCW